MPKEKKVRGIRPGVRGPAKSEAEREAEREALRTKRLESLARGRLNVTHRGSIFGTARSKEAHQLQDLIQSIGDETIDAQTGWTRIEAVIRRVYADAMGGKHPAQELLFNRGWGRVPMPLKINVSAELSSAVQESGLSEEEAMADPLLRHLLTGGTTIEGSVNDDGPEQTDL